MKYVLYGSIRIMVTESSERRAGVGVNEDRISSLPKNVIDHILDCMPIRDAARASILSSKWRYVLTEYPHLVLNRRFSRERAQNRLPTQFNNDYVHIVNRILLQHFGPILKFVVHLPEIHAMRFVDVDQWMLFLSRKGVKELTLNNSSPSHYKTPSYIFSSPELTCLNMSRCVVKAPAALEGFSKLTHLVLKEITFGSSVLTIPQLVILIMRNCTGIHLLNVSAPLLQNLTLYENDDIGLSHYMICKKLTYAYITLPNGYQHRRQGVRISLTELFGCWCILSNAYLDGWFLKANSVVNNNAEVTNYLEEPNRMNQTIDGLQTVTMRFFKGSKPEVLFVKHILGCSPSLERVSIEEDEKLLPHERLRMAKELMRFSRASPKAEMIFQRLIIKST